MEAVDVGGMPVPNEDRTAVTFAPNKLFVFDKPEKKYLLLLDELSSCNQSVQLAAMQVALDRSINGNDIPDNVFIAAAGNRATDGSKVFSMLSPLANRFAHLEIEINSSEWCAWARQHGIHPKTIGFIGAVPDLLHAMDEEQRKMARSGVKEERPKGWYSGPWYSPRSVEAVSGVTWLVDEGVYDEADFYEQVAMECGDVFATQYIAFCKMAEAYDDVHEIMVDPTKKIAIPQKADMECAFAEAVVYNVWKANDDAEQERLVQGFYRIMTDSGMDSRFATKIMKEAKEGSSKVSKERACELLVTNHPVEFAAWAKKFGASNRSEI